MTFSQDFLNTCQNTTSINQQSLFLTKNCPSFSQPNQIKDSQPCSNIPQDSTCPRNRLGSQSSITSIETSSSSTSVSSYFSDSLVSPKSLSSSSSTSISSLNSKPPSTAFPEFNKHSPRSKPSSLVPSQTYSPEASKMHGFVANNNQQAHPQMPGPDHPPSGQYPVPANFTPNPPSPNYPFVTFNPNYQPQYSTNTPDIKPTTSSSHHSSRDHRSHSSSSASSGSGRRHARHSHSAPGSISSSSSSSSSTSVTSIAALVSSPLSTPVSVSIPAPSPMSTPSTTTPTTVFRDNEGVDWITFTYSKDRIPKEHRIRCDIETVNINELTEEFKKDNCIYPRACVVMNEYKGNRWKYETQCNAIGWCLTWINPSIRKKRGLIQRAVDNWRNTNADPTLRSRRVRRMSRKNDKMKCSAITTVVANAVPNQASHLNPTHRPSTSPSSIIYQQPSYQPETPTAPYYYYTTSDAPIPQHHQQQQSLATPGPTPTSQQYPPVVMYENNSVPVYPNQFMVQATHAPQYQVSGQLATPLAHSPSFHQVNYR